MPAVNLAKTVRRKSCDPIKELIVGRAAAYHIKDEAMAGIMGVTPATYSKRKNKQSSSEWTWGEIQKCCKALDISADELRAAIRV